MIRDRLRKNFAAVNGHRDTEVCFLVEGHTKGRKRKTHLHIHGFALASRFPGETYLERKEALLNALCRTMGHARVTREVHAATYSRDKHAYTNYQSRSPVTLRHIERICLGAVL